MPMQLRFTPSISASMGGYWDKNEKKWWTRDLWPCRRWARQNSARGGRRLELDNAASPVLSYGKGGDAKVEDALAELFTGWLSQRCDRELGRGRRCSAELAAGENGQEREGREGNERRYHSGRHRGNQEYAPGLTGKVAIEVRLPQGTSRVGQLFSDKLNRVIQLPMRVTETRSSPTFYSRSVR